MKFSFAAKILKAGINPYVSVPENITSGMPKKKGYIPVKGLIRDHFFKQTLVPVKGDAYRLFVNAPMLKGANARIGEKIEFQIEQDSEPRFPSMPEELAEGLKEHGQLEKFSKLIPSRQKEILNYINSLKTSAAIERTIRKVIEQLKKKK